MGTILPDNVVECSDGPAAIEQPDTVLGLPPLLEVPQNTKELSQPGEAGEGGLAHAGPPPCMTMPAYLQSHCR